MVNLMIKHFVGKLRKLDVDTNADTKSGNIEKEISEIRHALYHLQIDIKVLSYIIILLILTKGLIR